MIWFLKSIGFIEWENLLTKVSSFFTYYDFDISRKSTIKVHFRRNQIRWAAFENIANQPKIICIGFYERKNRVRIRKKRERRNRPRRHTINFTGWNGLPITDKNEHEQNVSVKESFQFSNDFIEIPMAFHTLSYWMGFCVQIMLPNFVSIVLSGLWTSHIQCLVEGRTFSLATKIHLLGEKKNDDSIWNIIGKLSMR